MTRLMAIIVCMATVAVLSLGMNIQAGTQDEDEGERLLTLRCMKCHDLKRVKEADNDRDDWEKVVKRMMRIGAGVTPAEKEILVDYLAR